MAIAVKMVSRTCDEVMVLLGECFRDVAIDWAAESLEIGSHPAVLEVISIGADVNLVSLMWHQGEEVAVSCSGVILVGFQSCEDCCLDGVLVVFFHSSVSVFPFFDLWNLTG